MTHLTWMSMLRPVLSRPIKALQCVYNTARKYSGRKFPVHKYTASIEWKGNKGTGTSSYKAYSRDYETTVAGKPPILGSSDPAFLGDPARWNPEDLLLASTAACHELWYLHLCASAGITVISYVDKASGKMVEGPIAKFTEIVLQPHVVVKKGDNVELAEQLHHAAHEQCFIANSLNFPVRCEPTFETETLEQE